MPLCTRWAIVYALGSFLLTFTRYGVPVVLGLQQAQVVSLLVLAGVAALYVYRRVRPATGRPSGTQVSTTPAGA